MLKRRHCMVLPIGGSSSAASRWLTGVTITLWSRIFEDLLCFSGSEPRFEKLVAMIKKQKLKRNNRRTIFFLRGSLDQVVQFLFLFFKAKSCTHIKSSNKQKKTSRTCIFRYTRPNLPMSRVCVIKSGSAYNVFNLNNKHQCQSKKTAWQTGVCLIIS